MGKRTKIVMKNFLVEYWHLFVTWHKCGFFNGETFSRKVSSSKKISALSGIVFLECCNNRDK